MFDDAGDGGDGVDETDPKDGYYAEAKCVFKRWCALEVDWMQHYGKELAERATEGEQFDVVADLMDLDMGVLYKKIQKTDPERKVYGFLPLMAANSYGQIGALNAESFCERVLSAANLIVTKGNTLLADEEVIMAVLLRINREFMEHMRANHKAEAKQAYNRTLVDIEKAKLLEEDSDEE